MDLVSKICKYRNMEVQTSSDIFGAKNEAMNLLEDYEYLGFGKEHSSFKEIV